MMFERLFGKEKFFWFVVKSEMGKLHKDAQEGPKPAGRRLVNPERLAALERDPKSHIQMDEINSYYFESRAARDQFLTLIKGRVEAPNPIRKKFVNGNQTTDDSKEKKSPTKGQVLPNTSRALENEKAGKTLPLGEATLDTNVDFINLTHVYLWEVINQKWTLTKKNPRQIREGSRPEVSEGPNSDFSRAKAGDLRSNELKQIFFRHQADAARIFNAYAEQTKTRRSQQK